MSEDEVIIRYPRLKKINMLLVDKNKDYIQNHLAYHINHKYLTLIQSTFSTFS